MIQHYYVEQLERDLEAMKKDRDGLKAALLAQVKQQSDSMRGWAKESAALKIRVGVLERDNAALRNKLAGLENQSQWQCSCGGTDCEGMKENAALRKDKERLDELLEHGVVGWYAGPRKWIGDQKITRCYTREDIDAARAKEGEA